MCTALYKTEQYAAVNNTTQNTSILNNPTPAPAPCFVVPLCFPTVVQWGQWDNGDPPTLTPPEGWTIGHFTKYPGRREFMGLYCRNIYRGYGRHNI